MSMLQTSAEFSTHTFGSADEMTTYAKILYVHTEVKVMTYSPVRSIPMVAAEMRARWDQMEEVMTLADAAYHANKVITAVTPSSSSRGPVMLLYSVPLLSALLAFAIAQFLKVITTWYKEKRWDPKKIVGSGGMPSSHSSTVVALAVSIGLHDGIDSSSFAIAVVMAFIVMYDATGVRLHAGRQAEVLNQIVCEFPPEHPLSTSIPLRDSLGHTPLQVVAGAILGCIVAFAMKATD